MLYVKICEKCSVWDAVTDASATIRHGAEQYAGDLECVFYGYHLDRAILKNAEAAYCLMPSLATIHSQADMVGHVTITHTN